MKQAEWTMRRFVRRIGFTLSAVSAASIIGSQIIGNVVNKAKPVSEFKGRGITVRDSFNAGADLPIDFVQGMQFLNHQIIGNQPISPDSKYLITRTYGGFGPAIPVVYVWDIFSRTLVQSHEGYRAGEWIINEDNSYELVLVEADESDYNTGSMPITEGWMNKEQ